MQEKLNQLDSLYQKLHLATKQHDLTEAWMYLDPFCPELANLFLPKLQLNISKIKLDIDSLICEMYDKNREELTEYLDTTLKEVLNSQKQPERR